MGVRSLFLVAMTSAVLVGCNSTGKPRELSPLERPFLTVLQCAQQECPVAVTVTENAATGTCSGSVDFALIDFRTGPHGARKARWTITDGYVFSSEPYKFGIFIKSDPRRQFRNATVSPNGKRLVIDFAHQASGNTYEYSLTFQRANGDFCETLDPWMVD